MKGVTRVLRYRLSKVLSLRDARAEGHLQRNVNLTSDKHKIDTRKADELCVISGR